MLFTQEKVENKELDKINEFFNNLEQNIMTVSPEEEENSSVSRYITSLANNCYAKSVEAIANTNTSNTIVKKKNLQQVMQESFFGGANRFGNNFIA